MITKTSTNYSAGSLISALLLSSMLSFTAISAAYADGLPANVQAKVDSYKKKITEWAADPVLVAAVKEANAKGPIAGMNNAKWSDLDEKDQLAVSLQTSAAGKIVTELSKDPGISKLYLRDEHANLVASSNKALVYNNGTKPWITDPMKDGKAWSGKEIKPDPTTQIKGVHLSAPILSGGKPIGILHTSVVAE